MPLEAPPHFCHPQAYLCAPPWMKGEEGEQVNGQAVEDGQMGRGQTSTSWIWRWPYSPWPLLTKGEILTWS